MPINTEYFLKPGETQEQYFARSRVTQRQETAKTAGAAGLSLNDTTALFGATPEEERAKKDELAKTFGFDTFDAFTKDMFTKPSKTTEQFYRDAYSAAGLDGLRSRVEKRKKELAEAEFAINDNPWLSEASRSGRVRRLQELANADIATDEEAYRLGLDEVKNLVSAHAADIGADDRMREARFNYLLKAAEEATSKTGTARLRENLTSYLSGKQANEKPDTISVGEGNAIYRWNPSTGTFEHVITRPKTYAPKTPAKSSAANSSTIDKTISAFRKSLANRAAVNRAGTREQFIRELQAQYPAIDPGDIERAVYETYPDNFDKKK